MRHSPSGAPDTRSDLFETLARNLPGMVYLSRNDACYTKLYLNDAVEALTGYPADEFLWRRISFADLHHPDDRERIHRTVDAALADDRPFHLEYRLRHADGSYRWVEEYGQGIRNVEGELAYLEGTLFDITERRRAQEVLERSEERFSKAFLSNPNPAVITTLLDGTILEINRVLCEMSGLRRDELIGQNGSTLGLWEEEHSREMVHRLAEDGAVRAMEIRAHGRNGKVYDLLVSAVVVEMDGEECVLNVGVDITERKHLETQLLRAQRLESIGTLAGGLAHDLNNVLTPILMAMKLLRQDRPKQRERVLSILESNARRGADLIRQLLTFARGAEGKRVPVEVRSLVREVAAIARDTFPKTIELSVQVHDDVWRVEGDPTQLHQVLLNLAVNARDAMDGRGRLAITAANRELGAQDLRRRPGRTPGRYVLIEVADSGPGIPRELREQVFDPFFTTKDPAHGTGLGLFTVETITSAHGGFVEIGDGARKGEGARFRVYLPVAPRHDREADRRSLLPPLEGRGELVLLADDEEAVREIAAGVLEASGYRILLAADGRAALDRFEERRGEVRVAVVDLMMPRMDGAEAIRALRATEPDLPIIAMSGFEGEGEGAELLAGADLLLHKPLTAEDLLGALRKALAPRPEVREQTEGRPR